MIEYQGKEYWQGLLDRETQPLTDNESEMYMRCVMMDMEGVEFGQNPEWDKEVQASPQYQIISSRLGIAGSKASIPVILFLSTLCNSPGKCVVWAYTLQMMRAIRGIEGPVKMEDLSYTFPMGFPVESEYSAAWSEQNSMSENGNFVDKYDNWPKVD